MVRIANESVRVARRADDAPRGRVLTRGRHGAWSDHDDPEDRHVVDYDHSAGDLELELAKHHQICIGVESRHQALASGMNEKRWEPGPVLQQSAHPALFVPEVIMDAWLRQNGTSAAHLRQRI
jgi:hypothetical protein